MCIDFFVSHTKENKNSFAIPLAQNLCSLGFDVWIDRKEIVVGDYIYTEIEEAIIKSKYCVAIIDSFFLNRAWPLKELNLFHDRELIENRTLILPIFLAVSKEEVYETIPWMEGRAFEIIKESSFDINAHFNTICRLLSKHFKMSYTINLEKLTKNLITYSFPCKTTLITLLQKREFLSNELRISIIELCNIGGIVNAIYKALTISPNKIVENTNLFCNVLREKSFDTDFILSYDMYISATYAVTASTEQLEILLNSR